MAFRALDVLSTCFWLESHSSASLLKRALLMSWLDVMVAMLRGCMPLIGPLFCGDIDASLMSCFTLLWGGGVAG